MPKIKYTNREFASIKEELIKHAKRYYPTTFQDFNEASFGSIMLDSVAYIGDVLSFYLDYQANEQFLSTAVEYDNVIGLAKQSGFRFQSVPTTSGICSFYVLIPAAATGGVDERYAPVLQKGTMLGSDEGGTFILAEDVNFSNSNLETLVAKVNTSTGLPIYYARKGFGRVVSGKIKRKSITIGEFQRFRKVNLGEPNVAEIISVTDSEGYEYFHVDYLSQNVVYKSILNNNTDKNSAPFIMKPFPVPRRFTTETTEETTFLRFGFGSESELSTDSVVDPTNLILDLYGKDYSTDESFDPKKLLQNDKLGVGPSDTTLYVEYRVNVADYTNVGPHSVNSVKTRSMKFNSSDALDPDVLSEVRGSVQVDNEDAIVGDIAEIDSDEIRVRALDMFATQNRAVTREDYVSLVYAMDKKFGSVARCNIYKDEDSFKNNLNLYVVSEDDSGFLTPSNQTIKENVKTWLSKYKMINDSIDILNARIVNFGIDFEVVSSMEHNKFDVLQNALTNLQFDIADIKFDIGESIKMSDIYQSIISTKGVIDVTDLQVFQKSSSGYEQTSFKFDQQKSSDGRFVIAPKDVIFEIRYPSLDIRGSVK